MSQITPNVFSICLGKFRFLESDQQKIRPVIVVSKPHGNRRILMAIPISSSSKAESVDVALQDWQEHNLLKPSIARVHRLSAMLENDVLEEIGMLGEEQVRSIKASLKQLLDI